MVQIQSWLYKILLLVIGVNCKDRILIASKLSEQGFVTCGYILLHSHILYLYILS